jgi:N-acetylmuramoyl-L-alanine amidase
MGGEAVEKRILARMGHTLLGLMALMALMALLWPQGAMPTLAAPAETGPLKGRVIAVDAGHGGYDGGAKSPGGLWEKGYNLAISEYLREELYALGADVVMTRDGDYALCDAHPQMRKKRQDMERRADLVLVGGAELLISVHMNNYRDSAQSGPQVFYRADCPAGQRLAEVMQTEMIEALSPRRKRSAQVGDFYMLSLGIPSVLVECGFLSNPAEEALLRSDAYRRQVAAAIADGVVAWFALEETPEAAAREDR